MNFRKVSIANICVFEGKYPLICDIITFSGASFSIIYVSSSLTISSPYSEARGKCTISLLKNILRLPGNSLSFERVHYISH